MTLLHLSLTADVREGTVPGEIAELFEKNKSL